VLELSSNPTRFDLLHANKINCSRKIVNFRKFENIYIGWGHKFSAESYGPSQPAAVQDEFIQGLDLVESEDPSPDQEAVLKVEETEGGAEEEAVVDEDEEEDDS
jgi:radial spoke head protein 4A